MARQSSELEFNSFVGGLITEASVMNFPENASVDEANFVLNRDGSRSRRLGMNLEDGHEEHTSFFRGSTASGVYTSSYSWEDATSDLSTKVAVVQIGAELRFFDMSSGSVSGNLIHTESIATGIYTATNVSYTSVDGLLIVAHGEDYINYFKYEDGLITSGDFRLEIRDLFGVEDYYEGRNLREGNDVSFRPDQLTQEHAYNLRNQGWGVPWRGFTEEDLVDPIYLFKRFVEGNEGQYPSNADNIATGIFPNADESDDRVGDRFNAESLIKNPSASGGGASGHLIIDLLNRGASRLTAIAGISDKYPNIPRNGLPPITDVTSLPDDYTSGGCTCVESFAGRVWYSGFGNDVTDGGIFSPQLAGYVLFSQIYSSTSDLSKCYQAADPTNYIDNELVDTDGGYVRIDGANNILRLKQLGSSLFVFASNGVWSIAGGSGYGFTATDYVVSKITSAGLAGLDSIVTVEDSLMYWSEDGIYALQKNEYGDYSSESISKATIQSLYNGIPYLDKYYAKGIYDSFTRTVNWMYNNRYSSTSDFEELILDIDLGAFYRNTIAQPEGCSYRPLSYIQTPPFSVGSVEDVVTVEGDTVYVNGSEVMISGSSGSSSVKEVMYLTMLDSSGSVVFGSMDFTFASYSNTNFVDWYDYNDEGVDAYAYLATGYLMPGATMRKKGVTYLGMHFERTENGFTIDDNGDLQPSNQSSCLVRPLWDWTNSANSNKWGRQFQAYRYRRFYMPEDASDSFDTGYEVITTKNKLRGSGRAISLLMETEPLKDCRIIGWSMIGSVAGNV